MKRATVTASRFGFRCLRCGTVYQNIGAQLCTNCRGAVDVFYNLNNVVIRSSANPLHKYFQLLPIQSEEHLLWLGEGNTPCFRAEDLGASLGLDRLFLKNETANPTCTTKDRIASVGLSCLRELGVADFVVSSTGNSSTSYARGVQLLEGFHVHIFVGEEFLGRLGYADHPNIQTHVVSGAFDAAVRAAKEFAAKERLWFEGGFFNIARREGLKLAYLEAYDEMASAGTFPHFVFQAISSGMGLFGAYNGARDYLILGRIPYLPRFIGVQQDSCAPMAHAYRDGSAEIEQRHIVQEPKGLASAILRGDPSQMYSYIRDVVQASHGCLLEVKESEIVEAQRRVFEYEGLSICAASATAVAGMIRMVSAKAITSSDTVLVNITGADRPKRPFPKVLHP